MTDPHEPRVDAARAAFGPLDPDRMAAALRQTPESGETVPLSAMVGSYMIFVWVVFSVAIGNVVVAIWLYGLGRAALAKIGGA
jgi:hypothetical protein